MEDKIFFTDSKGTELCALLADVGKDKIAILCHGHGTSKESKSWSAIVPILNAAGVSTFRFDFLGNGESEGDFAESKLSDSIDATLKAIALVKSKDFKKIILVGSSFGGLSSTITAAKSKDLYALALRFPVSDCGEVHLNRYGNNGMAEWKQKGWVPYKPNDGKGRVLNYSFVEDYEKYDTYSLAAKIAIPTLIVHGTSDEVVPFSQSEKLAAIISSATLIPIKGADHRCTQEDKFQQMVQHIADFVIHI